LKNDTHTKEKNTHDMRGSLQARKTPARGRKSLGEKEAY